MTKRQAIKLIFICTFALLPAMAFGAPASTPRGAINEAVSSDEPMQTAILDDSVEEPLILDAADIALIDVGIAGIAGEYSSISEYEYGLFAAMEDTYAIKTEPIPINETAGLCEWSASLYPSDMPIVINKNVNSFIRYFQTRGRTAFTKWLSTTAAYMPMISGILEEAGLPLDLVYLALKESGPNP